MEEILLRSKEIFTNKLKDYGPSWTIMRLPSITDQIWIKAKRIRSIQENKLQEIDETIEETLYGVLNYTLIALIQLKLLENPSQDIVVLFDQEVNTNIELQKKKDKDYGKAWVDMRMESIVDIILMKLIRVKQIEDNNGVTTISEPVEGSYRDIFNYTIFCLLKIKGEA